MTLRDDGPEFGDEVIAERAASLCEVAEAAFQELKHADSSAIAPLYIIGSEVTIPGGADIEEEEQDALAVTKPEAFEKTVKNASEAFERHGIISAFERVVGVVVQPGVEFGSDNVWEYDAGKAAVLINALNKYQTLIFEAHSTDYQTKEKLREMVHDGMVILKVGPALTFGFREGVVALSYIEDEIIPQHSRSNFREVLEKVMVSEPEYWDKHYKGSSDHLKFERKYCQSDRCRYYWPNQEVEKAIEKLLSNLNDIQIPLTVISQFMPVQYREIRSGNLKNNPNELIRSKIAEYIEDYQFAIKGKKYC